MEVGPKNAVLIVKKAERSDEGPYKVELENEQGSTTADTNVKVLSKYKKYVYQVQDTLDQRNAPHFNLIVHIYMHSEVFKVKTHPSLYQMCPRKPSIATIVSLIKQLI